MLSVTEERGGVVDGVRVGVVLSAVWAKATCTSPLNILVTSDRKELDLSREVELPVDVVVLPAGCGVVEEVCAGAVGVVEAEPPDEGAAVGTSDDEGGLEGVMVAGIVSVEVAILLLFEDDAIVVVTVDGIVDGLAWGKG